jgi:hypothetical protein
MSSQTHSIRVEGDRIYVDGVLIDRDQIKISIHFSTPVYNVEFDLEGSPISFEGTFTVEKPIESSLLSK